jgi:hypothetical protein
MNLRSGCIACTLALSCSLPAAAQSPADPEVLAQPREGESADFDMQSIRRYGDVLGTFQVSILWTDRSRPFPEDYNPRRVRYAVNCQEGTLTLAAIALFDRSGQLQKTMVVPPGASDPVKPEKGTEQAKWVQRACMF